MGDYLVVQWVELAWDAQLIKCQDTSGTSPPFSDSGGTSGLEFSIASVSTNTLVNSLNVRNCCPTVLWRMVFIERMLSSHKPTKCGDLAGKKCQRILLYAAQSLTYFLVSRPKQKPEVVS